MIQVTKLNGIQIFINAELIEQLESAPDTVITLTTGNNFLVRETVEEVRDRIMRYRKEVASALNDKVLF